MVYLFLRKKKTKTFTTNLNPQPTNTINIDTLVKVKLYTLIPTSFTNIPIYPTKKFTKFSIWMK